MVDLISTANLSHKRFSITLFGGFFNTLPADEALDVPWSVVVQTLAPKTPAIVVDKEKAPYFITCALKISPLVGKTLEKAKSLGLAEVGKQRSASHTTPSNIPIFEFDGMEVGDWLELLARLKGSGLTALIYSTHSYGRTDKLGVRVRILMPMDDALPQSDFSRAWQGVANTLFNGVKGLDPSSRNIHQQQGTFVAHPERSHLAFRYDLRGQIISAKKALAAAPPPIKWPEISLPYKTTNSDAENLSRLEATLPWLDADNTQTWTKNITAFKAVGEFTKPLAITYSLQGSEASQAKNDDPRYSPDLFFDNVKPIISPGVGMSVLCGQAKDAAIHCVNNHPLKDKKLEALAYLARHHKTIFQELRSAAA